MNLTHSADLACKKVPPGSNSACSKGLQLSSGLNSRFDPVQTGKISEIPLGVICESKRVGLSSVTLSNSVNFPFLNEISFDYINLQIPLMIH